MNLFNFISAQESDLSRTHMVAKLQGNLTLDVRLRATTSYELLQKMNAVQHMTYADL